MLAFNNHVQPISEDAKMVAEFQKSEPLPWESGCLAEKIYSGMDPITPAARVALLCGYASFRDSRQAQKMAEECRANGIKLPLLAHNLLIAHHFLAAGWEKSWGHVEKALNLMLEDGCRPDAGTIRAMLDFLFRAANRFGREAPGAKALEVMAEAREAKQAKRHNATMNLMIEMMRIAKVLRPFIGTRGSFFTLLRRPGGGGGEYLTVHAHKLGTYFKISRNAH